MSVAAMTMDDQRPLMNSYDKMSAKYDPNVHLISSSSSNSSNSGGGNGGVGAGVGGNGGAGGGVVAGGGGVGAPGAIINSGPSGPASPTPSVFEDQQQPHHHHHHHHHHATTTTQTQQTQEQQQQHRHHHHQQQQQQDQQQQQLQQQQHDAAVAEAVAAAEQRRLLEDEIENLKLEQTRLGMQCADAQRREKILMRRLANKEQEFQDYVSQIAEYKAQQAPTALALRTALLDPAVNLLFERLKKELKATKAKLEETQNELSAWKFTPDSNTGKRLMAKCRLLYQENEELGKMTSNGRLAKLETELAMQKSFSEEVKKSQSELDDFLQELDEDVEGMQSTILFLQQELKTTRDRINTLEKENTQLRLTNSGSSPKASGDNAATTAMAATNGQSSNCNANNASNNNINQFQQSIASSSKLETIAENACLEITNTQIITATTTFTGDYYNGNNNDQQTAAPELVMPLDDSNKNGAAARLARKRNYEEENATMVCVKEAPLVPAMREISAPRTLPPKKSKLRGIPTIRNSQLEEEQNHGLITATPLVLDNAVAGMASEESAAAPTPIILDAALPLITDATTEATAATPGRILTRRRSVRMQQNGGSSIDY